ncbi:DUF4251 domain-containing protein [Maribacter sp. CXY002]|uniref:DUF4251 domain-containing protein n=1 Tax=Maribacter luteocoastalis TaxID=3407671 RepID=UPI003B66C7C1
MTLYRILGVVLIGIMVLGCTSSQKTVRPNPRLEKMVADHAFKIEIQTAEPMVTAALAQIANSGLLPPGNTMNRIDVKGDGYFIQMDGEKVSANLPYFGEQQMGGGYGTDAGIVFDTQASDVQIAENAMKHSYDISFDVNDGTESFSITVELSPKLNSTVRIASSHRNRIRYTGKVKELKNVE